MINTYKNKKIYSKLNTVAGVHPADENIEFFGDINPITNKQEVFWIQNGATHSWKHLSKENFNICYNALINDTIAYSYLTNQFPSASENRKTELFIYTNYGHLDYTPDIIKGVLQPSENFRTAEDCPSLDWQSKWITIKGIILTKREIKMLDCFSKQMLDKQIAEVISVSHSYLDQLKRNLCSKVGVYNKTGLLMLAMQEKIIFSS